MLSSSSSKHSDDHSLKNIYSSFVDVFLRKMMVAMVYLHGVWLWDFHFYCSLIILNKKPLESVAILRQSLNWLNRRQIIKKRCRHLVTYRFGPADKRKQQSIYGSYLPSRHLYKSSFLSGGKIKDGHQQWEWHYLNYHHL